MWVNHLFGGKLGHWGPPCYGGNTPQIGSSLGTMQSFKFKCCKLQWAIKYSGDLQITDVSPTLHSAQQIGDFRIKNLASFIQVLNSKWLHLIF